MPTVNFEPAPDIEVKIRELVHHDDLKHISPNQVHAFRSTGSKARAYARIYAMPHIWQLALGVPAHYCVEFITEKFERLPQTEQTKVIIHELMHIPKTFSGALVPHRGRGRRHQVTHLTVDRLFKKIFG